MKNCIFTDRFSATKTLGIGSFCPNGCRISEIGLTLKFRAGSDSLLDPPAIDKIKLAKDTFLISDMIDLSTDSTVESAILDSFRASPFLQRLVVEIIKWKVNDMVRRDWNEVKRQVIFQSPLWLADQQLRLHLHMFKGQLSCPDKRMCVHAETEAYTSIYSYPTESSAADAWSMKIDGGVPLALTDPLSNEPRMDGFTIVDVFREQIEKKGEMLTKFSEPPFGLRLDSAYLRINGGINQDYVSLPDIEWGQDVSQWFVDIGSGHVTVRSAAVGALQKHRGRTVLSVNAQKVSCLADIEANWIFGDGNEIKVQIGPGELATVGVDPVLPGEMSAKDTIIFEVWDLEAGGHYLPNIKASASLVSKQDVSFLLANHAQTASGYVVDIQIDGRELLRKVAGDGASQLRFLKREFFPKGNILVFPSALDLHSQQIQSLSYWQSDGESDGQPAHGGEETKTMSGESSDASSEHDSFKWAGEEFGFDANRVIEARFPFAREAILTILSKSCPDDALARARAEIVYRGGKESENDSNLI